MSEMHYAVLPLLLGQPLPYSAMFQLCMRSIHLCFIASYHLLIGVTSLSMGQGHLLSMLDHHLGPPRAWRLAEAVLLGLREVWDEVLEAVNCERSAVPSII